MSNWKIKINEVSNNVYTLIMTHKFGSIIEKTGTDLEKMKKEAIKDSVQIEKHIKAKLKN